jgi:hypothetical protein
MENKPAVQIDTFREPELIKAGDYKLGLGYCLNPPKVDCRVIAEDNYQILMAKIEALELENKELKKENEGLINDCKTIDKKREEMRINFLERVDFYDKENEKLRLKIKELEGK